MSEKGRTMLEMMMVLAIIGVLTILSLFGYRMAIRRHMSNQAAKYVQVLAASSRSWLGVQMANKDFSLEGLDEQWVVADNLAKYQQEYGTFPLRSSPTKGGFTLLPMDELMSGVRIEANEYFNIFEDARVSAMLTEENDVVVNVEGMTVKECKELVLKNVDSDEIISNLTGNRFIRCSPSTYTQGNDCSAGEVSLTEVAESICVPQD